MCATEPWCRGEDAIEKYRGCAVSSPGEPLFAMVRSLTAVVRTLMAIVRTLIRDGSYPNRDGSYPYSQLFVPLMCRSVRVIEKYHDLSIVPWKMQQTTL